MYMFTRESRLAPGNSRASIEWALTLTEKINQIVELDVSLWTRIFSPGFGTLAWSTFAQDLAQLEAANDKLGADTAYLDLVDQGAAYASQQPIDDILATVVHPAELPAPDGSTPQPTYVSVVRAVLAPGNFAKGVLTGIEIATRASAISGQPTLFLSEASGSYGGVAWITGYADVATLQAAGEAVNGDLDFVGYVDSEASGCYQPASVTQLQYRRLV